MAILSLLLLNYCLYRLCFLSVLCDSFLVSLILTSSVAAASFSRFFCVQLFLPLCTHRVQIRPSLGHTFRACCSIFEVFCLPVCSFLYCFILSFCCFQFEDGILRFSRAHHCHVHWVHIQHSSVLVCNVVLVCVQQSVEFSR